MNELSKDEYISPELAKAIYAHRPYRPSDNPALDIFRDFRDVLKIISKDPELH